MSSNQKILTAALLVLSMAACDRKQPEAVPVVTPAPEDSSGLANTPAAPSAPGVQAGTTGLVPESATMTSFDLVALTAAKPVRAACAIDVVNDEPALGSHVASVGGDIVFKGWILNPQKQAPPSFGLVLADGEKAYVLRGETGGNRPDVVRAVASSEAAKSGFALAAKLENVEPGLYEVSLVQDTNNIVSRCVTRAKLSIGR